MSRFRTSSLSQRAVAATIFMVGCAHVAIASSEEAQWMAGPPAVLDVETSTPVEAEVMTPSSETAPSFEAARIERVVVAAVTGQAQVCELGQTQWRTIKVGDVVGVGTTIRTGLRSSVELKPESGGSITVSALSRCCIREMLAGNSGPRAALELDYGDLDSRLAIAPAVIGTGYQSLRVVVPERTLAVGPLLVAPDAPRNPNRFDLPKPAIPGSGNSGRPVSSPGSSLDSR